MINYKSIFLILLISPLSGKPNKFYSILLLLFWIKIALDSQTFNVSAIKNRITFIKSDSLSANAWLSLSILDVPTPLDEVSFFLIESKNKNNNNDKQGYSKF